MDVLYASLIGFHPRQLKGRQGKSSLATDQVYAESSSSSIANYTSKLSCRKDDRVNAMRPIHGCPENFRESLTTRRPRLLFPKLLMGLVTFVPIDPMNVRTKFEIRSFTRS